jgi:hypothetical protein
MSDTKFKVFSYKHFKIKDGEPAYGYEHVLQNRVLIIEKDGVKMKLNDQEIAEIIKAVGMDGHKALAGFRFKN